MWIYCFFFVLQIALSQLFFVRPDSYNPCEPFVNLSFFLCSVDIPISTFFFWLQCKTFVPAFTSLLLFKSIQIRHYKLPTLVFDHCFYFPHPSSDPPTQNKANSPAHSYVPLTFALPVVFAGIWCNVDPHTRKTWCHALLNNLNARQAEFTTAVVKIITYTLIWKIVTSLAILSKVFNYGLCVSHGSAHYWHVNFKQFRM